MARAKAKSVKRRAIAKPLKRKIRARVCGATLQLLDPLPMMLRDGEEIVVTLSKSAFKPDLDALRSAAGSWKGHVDADALIRNIYKDRLIQTRQVPRI